MTAPSAAVLAAIRAAATTTGVDLHRMLTFASIESGFDPNAGAESSSAVGLYQFIRQTWLGMLWEHGEAHGVDVSRILRNRREGTYSVVAGHEAAILDRRREPLLCSIMGGLFLIENVEDLTQALRGYDGRGDNWVPDDTDLYIAHFLGSAGAINFFAGCAQIPGSPAAADFPRAAQANPSVFYRKDAAGRRTQPRSYFQVWNWMDDVVKEHQAATRRWLKP